MAEYTLGEVVRVPAELRDENGDLVDNASLRVTFLLPDGTQTAALVPTHDTPPVAGVYHYDYTPATAGHYEYRWTTSGGVTAADDGMFDVLGAFGEHEYINRDDFKAYAGENTSTWDSVIDSTVITASRAIDTFCGRKFYLDATATPRVFATRRSDQVLVSDFGSTSGLVVATDDTDDGTFATTWAASDYELEPPNGVNDAGIPWPYTAVRAVGSHLFPTCGRRSYRVRVTARWGFPSTPRQVIQAAYIVTADMFAMKDNKFGVIGNPEFGVIRIGQNREVANLLGPFRVFGIA